MGMECYKLEAFRDFFAIYICCSQTDEVVMGCVSGAVLLYPDLYPSLLYAFISLIHPYYDAEAVMDNLALGQGDLCHTCVLVAGKIYEGGMW